MHIVLFCATNRGYRFASKLFQLGQGHKFTVFSFRETAWEPPFLEKIRSLTLGQGQRFIEARNVAHPDLQSFWREAPIDLILIASWRYLVPESVYSRARQGCFVFHDSLLPKYRGFAPTVWSIINGERETGVSLFRINDRMDAGDIVEQRRISISETETIAEVMERLTELYLELAERRFDSLLEGNVSSYPQNHDEATYTCKWTPEDALIDWRKSAREIFNLIRATGKPYPGAYTFLGNRKLTIWSADLPSMPGNYVSYAPGRVLESQPDGGATVLTGDGVIRLQTVQLDGEPIVNAGCMLTSLSLTLGRGI
ncbi:MAG: methionyl-tRNA formyltransferase [Chloroflexota bacterium]|nr:methionyl-tRNA formyltransferase [Chloroflexota bacterium]MDE2947564.1 methionyl-tRNA formyltransferase [Chloroflexota bacterium]